MPESRRSPDKEIKGALGALAELRAPDDACQEGVSMADYLTRYIDQVQFISDAAARMEYLGLHDICLLFHQWLLSIDARDSDPGSDVYTALNLWPGLVECYMQAPAAPATGEALVDLLCGVGPGVSLSDDDAGMLRSQFALDARESVDAETLLCTDATVNCRSDIFALEIPGRDAGKTDRDAPAAPAMEDEALSCLPDDDDEGAPDGDDEEAAAAQPIEDETLFCVPDGDDEGAPVAATTATKGAELPGVATELIEVLMAALPEVESVLAAGLERAVSEDIGPDARRAALEACGEELARFANAAEAVTLEGLQKVILHTRENVLALGETGRAISAGEHSALMAWSGHVLRYLEAPTDRPCCAALLEALGTCDWPLPLNPPDRESLLELLAEPDFTSLQSQVETRPQRISDDDVSLELPDGVDPDLLDAMLQDLPGQTEEFSAATQRLIQGGDSTDVEIAQRVAHTLKGAANTVGVPGIATLAHYLEDVLLVLSKHHSLPPGPLAESLLNAADCLEAMSETLMDAGSPPPEARTVAQDILDWANFIERDGLPGADDAPPSAAAEPATPQAEPATPQAEPVTPQAEPVTPHAAPVTPHAAPASPPDPPATDTDLEAPQISSGHDASVAAPGDAAPLVRIPVDLVNDMLRLAGESIILTGQVFEQVRRATGQAHEMQVQVQQTAQLGHDLEELIDFKGVGFERRQQGDDAGFDPLEMDQYNELHTFSRRLVESTSDCQEMGNNCMEHLTRLDEMLLAQERLNRDAQELVLRTRMVPVSSVVPRLQRSVRQTCRLTGKQAELEVRGADTLMDRDVLNDLLDPLMHVLRNAVDHGIEPAEQRAAAGKEATGHITLEFLREGNNVLVACRDDGAGLDFAAIRRTAQRHGLLREDQEVSDDELKRLVLRANFSTRTETTQTSGRGIGMDAVYTQVIALGGSFSLQSEVGEGCLVELRLPLTLISTRALLVRVGPHVVAISPRGVEQLLHPEAGSIRHYGEQLMFQIGDDVFPATPLESILHMSPERRAEKRQARPVLLVQDHAGTTAVPVEEVLDSPEVVVKNLGHFLPKMRGILGATILGDGRVVPVLDLPDLLHADDRGNAGVEPRSQSLAEPVARLPVALVVDDSLSVRRSLSRFMQDSGFEVRTARDGIEAIQMIEVQRPDILLADLEMPRMNGMELITHVRARESTADLPIIMITSRTTEKHRRQAEAAGVDVYLTKPFSEDDLLTHVHALQRNYGQGHTSHAAQA